MYTKMGLVSESKIAWYLFFFFYVTIFKVFIECVATLLALFMYWSFGHEPCGILAASSGIKPALGGDVLTTGPPGKSLGLSPLD